MKSMTAFAAATLENEILTVQTEIQTYNSKYLDILLRVPHGYKVLEEKIRELITQKISRGRVELRLNITNEQPDSQLFEVDTLKAQSYFEALLKLKETLGLNTEVSLDLIIKSGNIITAVDPEGDVTAYWDVIEKCVNNVLDGIATMRAKEGGFLKKDLMNRMTFIEQQINGIENASQGLVRIYQERLKERIEKLTDGTIAIDPERIAQEAAFLADRSDITEELVRARSHVAQFNSIILSNEPCGRKLNFLLQEFNREFNTMASKAANSEISQTVVAVKSELEKIREQVQNVE